MNKKYFIIGLAAIIVIFVLGLSVGGILSKNTQSKTTYSNENTYGTASSDTVQNVKLTLDSNYDYHLEPSVLKKGIPVKMEVDLNTVVGCARSITIPDLGVRKNVGSGDNIIQFIPTKTGTFRIQCSMNMYSGTFSVTDDGSATVQTQQAQTQAAAQPKKGGCGCGGGTSGSCGV